MSANIFQTDEGVPCGLVASADACADIHQAELLEMLDDLEDLIDPLHKQHFDKLKQRYEG